MDINTAFPSTWLKAADLGGKKIRLTIDRVVMDDVGDGEKPIVYFRGTDKGLVLNKTNSNTIADMLGSETDNWPGNQIVLFPTRVDYQGKRVDAIRIEFNQPPPRGQQQKPQQRMADSAVDDEKQMRGTVKYDERNPPPHVDDMNDEIPF